MRTPTAAAVLLAGLGLALCFFLTRATGITYDEPHDLALSWGYYNGLPPSAVRIAAPVPSYLRGAALLAAGAAAPQVPKELRGQSMVPHAYGQFFLFNNRVPGGTLLRFGRATGLLALAIMLAAVWFWGTTALGVEAALFALSFAALDPNMLAHFSLATADGWLTSFFIAALFLWSWARSSGPLWAAAAAGAAAGLAASSKATGAMLPGAFLAAEVWAWASGKRRTDGGKALLAALASMAVMIILAYAPTGLHGLWEAYAFRTGETLSPAPTYLFGRVWPQGHPLYFPAILAMKTTLPFLGLSLWGFADRRLWKDQSHRRVAFAGAGLLLLCAMSVRRQLGVRYVLPLYPVLAVAAGAAAASLWKRRGALRLAAGAALAWHAASSLAAMPQPLAYVNEAFGGPSAAWRLMGDSNVDWGQALPELTEFMKKNPGGLILSYFGRDCPARLGLERQDAFSTPGPCPGSSLLPVSIDREWLAVSATKRQGFYESGPPAWGWLGDRKPAAVVGRAILVYDITRDADAHERIAGMYAATGNPSASVRESARARLIRGK